MDRELKPLLRDKQELCLLPLVKTLVWKGTLPAGAEWRGEPVIRLCQSLLVSPSVRQHIILGLNFSPCTTLVTSDSQLLMFWIIEMYSFHINIRDSEGGEFLPVVYGQNLESGLKVVFCMSCYFFQHLAFNPYKSRKYSNTEDTKIISDNNYIFEFMDNIF